MSNLTTALICVRHLELLTPSQFVLDVKGPNSKSVPRMTFPKHGVTPMIAQSHLIAPPLPFVVAPLLPFVVKSSDSSRQQSLITQRPGQMLAHALKHKPKPIKISTLAKHPIAKPSVSSPAKTINRTNVSTLSPMHNIHRTRGPVIMTEEPIEMELSDLNRATKQKSESQSDNEATDEFTRFTKLQFATESDDDDSL